MLTLLTLISSARASLLVFGAWLTIARIKEILYVLLSILGVATILYAHSLERQIATSRSTIAILTANNKGYQDAFDKLSKANAAMQKQVDDYEKARAAEADDVQKLLSLPIPTDKSHVTPESIRSLNAASAAANRLLESSTK